MIDIYFDTVRLFFSIYLFFLSRIHDHGGTKTIVPLGSDQDVIIGTGFASFPELIIIGEFGKCDRMISQAAVDLHYSQTGSQSE